MNRLKCRGLRYIVAHRLARTRIQRDLQAEFSNVLFKNN